MSSINRGAFTSSFQLGTVDELAARASRNGVRLSDAQRDAIARADLDGDGVVGTSDAERRALWNAMDDLDRDGDRRSMSRGSGEGYSLARGLAVRGSYFACNRAAEAYADGQRDFRAAEAQADAGQHGTAAARYAEAAEKFVAAREAMDAPQARVAEMTCWDRAARRAEATGDDATAAHYDQRAADAARDLLARYPNVAQADRARQLLQRGGPAQPSSAER